MQVPPLYCTSQKQMPWWHSPWPEQLSVQLAFGCTDMKFLNSGYSLLGRWVTLLVVGEPRHSTMLERERLDHTADVVHSDYRNPRYLWGEEASSQARGPGVKLCHRAFRSTLLPSGPRQCTSVVCTSCRRPPWRHTATCHKKWANRWLPTHLQEFPPCLYA